jgi:hypothetical protein
MLDHLLLDFDDLDRGIAFVEEHTGVRAAFGGVHFGRGTRNALLSLGPDPKQPSVRAFTAITNMTMPRLVGWAAHPGHIGRLAQALREAGVPCDGLQPGSRARPDGGMLNWKTLELADDRQGVLPFFIEWRPDAVPSLHGRPAGRRLQQFAILSPVERGESAQCRARITEQKGDLEIWS